MDGPYAVEVKKTSAGMLQFRALEGPGRNNEVVTGEEQAIPFVRGLILHSREILAECKRQAWWSEDAEKLESLLKVLEQESAKLLS